MKLADMLTSLSNVDTEDDGWIGRCPAHNDSHASLRVAIGTTGAVMLKCRAGCATKDVLKSMGLEMADLYDVDMTGVEVVTARSTDALPSDARISAMGIELDSYAEALDDETREYAARRFGLTAEDCERLGIGMAASLGGAKRMVVPFRDQSGRTLGYQARALEDHRIRWLGPRNPKDASWSKIGWLPGVTGWDEVVITEGPGDGLTAVAAGYDTILIRGAGLVRNQSTLDQLAGMLAGRVAVLAGDGDSAGQTFNRELAMQLVSRGILVREIPVKPGSDLAAMHEEDPEHFTRDLAKLVQRSEVRDEFETVVRGWDRNKYPLTDLGAARRLRDYLTAEGSGVHYAPDAGWFLLDNGVWVHSPVERVRSRAQELSEKVVRPYLDLLQSRKGGAADEDQATWRKREIAEFARFAARLQSKMGIDAFMVELGALHDVLVALDEFDSDEYLHLLPINNGVVNLRTGELLAHDAKRKLTKRVELDYDESAKAAGWEKFLSEVFPDYPDAPGYIQRLVGYGITGETREQCFAVFYGRGANGKSVFTSTLNYVFQGIATTTPFETFEQKPSGSIPNDLAALRGARLVHASEGEAGRLMAESIIKRVTGSEPISARFMRQEYFTFDPRFLLMLATNSKPKFRGADDGLWRRVKLISWSRFFKPSERDHQLTFKLRDEAAGILAWAVRGAVEWYAGGLRDPDFVKSATSEYRDTSDSLSGFLARPGTELGGAAWLVTDDLDDWAKAGDLWNGYLEWCQEENLPGKERWTRKVFYGALEERSLVRRTLDGYQVFRGVRKVRTADHHEDASTPDVTLSVTSEVVGIDGPDLGKL